MSYDEGEAAMARTKVSLTLLFLFLSGLVALRAFVAFEEGVLAQLVAHQRGEVQRRHLQQPDGLLQPGRQHGHRPLLGTDLHRFHVTPPLG